MSKARGTWDNCGKCGKRTYSKKQMLIKGMIKTVCDGCYKKPKRMKPQLYE